MWAAENVHLDVVKCLLDAKADANLNVQGLTALMFAAGRPSSDAVVSCLLAHGANASAVSDEGSMSPLLSAVGSGGSVSVVNALLDAKANPNSHGSSTLVLALQRRHWDIALRLFESGAHPHGALSFVLHQAPSWFQAAPIAILELELCPGLRAIEICTWMGWDSICTAMEDRGIAFDEHRHPLLECWRSNLCTYSVTGSRFEMQFFVSCATCWPDAACGAGVCRSCALSCHAGHTLREATFVNSFCDCFENGSCVLNPQ